MITQLLKRRVGSDGAVARFGQVICFGAACIIPILAFRRFAELDMSEVQLLIGVLATMSLALLCAVAGLHLERQKKGSAKSLHSPPR
jgi:uncharacterized membrane protein